MNGIIKRSLENGNPLEIIYIDCNEKISQRTVRVLGINETTIKVYCYIRKQKRNFKLSNILSVVPIRKSYNKVS